MALSEVRSRAHCRPIEAFDIPLRLMLLEHLPLCVVSDVLDIDETAQIELFRPELCHDAGR